MVEREVVTTPFHKVSIDLVGPFPTAKRGYKYLLTCVDEATRRPEAIPIRTPTASSIISILREVFSRNVFPAEIVSDNGSQFVSTQFQKFLSEHSITHIRSSPYSPQSNGVRGTLPQHPEHHDP